MSKFLETEVLGCYTNPLGRQLGQKFKVAESVPFVEKENES